MFHYSNGEWFPYWAILFLPFLFWLWFLVRRTMRFVNWKAAYATTIVFEFVLGATEIISVWRGHWVYNEARIWGPRLFNVPIEEHLLYYFFSSLVVVTAYHSIKESLEARAP